MSNERPRGTTWSRLREEAEFLAAMATMFAGIISLGAFLVVFYQMKATEHLENRSFARELYKELVAIQIEHPDVVSVDWSKKDSYTSEQQIAYEAYIEFILYTADHLLELDPKWKMVMKAWLEQEVVYLCDIGGFIEFSLPVQELTAEIMAGQCVAPSDASTEAPAAD
jgi:hypothetical protein